MSLRHCYSQVSGEEICLHMTVKSKNNYRAKNAHLHSSLMAVLQINYGIEEHKKPVLFCCTQSAMSNSTC